MSLKKYTAKKFLAVTEGTNAKSLELLLANLPTREKKSGCFIFSLVRNDRRLADLVPHNLSCKIVSLIS